MGSLSLCTGVGSLDAAVTALTGAHMEFCAESDPSASAALEHRLPEAVNLGDIAEVDWAAFAAENSHIGIITAGFPCQDISRAGGRAGISGERSGIWRNVADAVRHIRPRLVFLENVAAIRTRGLEVVLADLASIGYDARWTCLRASDVGAPHQRDRWFCVAHPADADGPRLEVGGEQPARQELPPTQRGGAAPADALGAGRSERRAEPAEQPGRLRRPAGCGGEPASAAQDADGEPWSERLGPAPGQAEGGRTRPDPGRRGRLSPAEWWGDYLPAIRRWERVTGAPAPEPTEIGPRGGRRLAASFAEWLMGWPAGWVTDVPGLTRAQQLHKIGNGVVPAQAFAAFERLVGPLESVADNPDNKPSSEDGVMPENTDAGISRATASHVLFQFGQGGYPPGSFTQSLLSAFATADPENKARLAAAFPALGSAVDLAENDPGGIARLRRIAGGRT